MTRDECERRVAAVLARPAHRAGVTHHARQDSASRAAYAAAIAEDLAGATPEPATDAAHVAAIRTVLDWFESVRHPNDILDDPELDRVRTAVAHLDAYLVSVQADHGTLQQRIVAALRDVGAWGSADRIDEHGITHQSVCALAERDHGRYGDLINEAFDHVQGTPS